MEMYPITNILIATAKRRKSPGDTVNDPVLSEIFKQSKKRGFISQEGRYDKHGKLPMNMIMSQTARRDKNSQAIEENCINESATAFEGVLSSYRFPNEKIKPWAKKTKTIFTAPTVVDVIQNKYYQLYRNHQTGLVSSSKNIAIENIKQEDPLEASEFPSFGDNKKSRLRVKWEDESPMGFMHPSKPDITHEEHSENTSFNDGINLRKENEIPPIEHPDFRFLELYKEKDLIYDHEPLEKIIIEDHALLGAMETEKGSNAVDNSSNAFFLQKNQYSSESYFLQSVTDSIKGDASSSRQRWDKNRLDDGFTNEFNVPQHESNLQLTCDVIDFENNSKFPLTCDLFEVPNLEEENNRLDEQYDSECSIYESPLLGEQVQQPLSSPFNGDSFFSFKKDTSKYIQGRTISPLFSSESPSVSSKEIHSNVYLSDPDDLLKTP